MTLTVDQVVVQQKASAEKDLARIKANLPAVPDSRSSVQKYLDDVAPASIAGRMIRFTKDKWITADNDEAISDNDDFIALADQTLIGWIRFNGEGEPPDRVMGLLYDGFVMPPRDSLGDADPAEWPLGLDEKPQDPWQHQINLVLQRGDELFTYATSSVTGRRCAGLLLRHYDRLRRTNPDMYPVVKLKIGGFQHRDERIGWVKTPVLAVVGRAPRESTAKPNPSLAADLNDQLPF